MVVRVKNALKGEFMKAVNVLSLGAGVQSSTLALMAARGEVGPMPDAAIFADTESEPKSVYAWLSWLEQQLPFPVYRVSQGNLRNASLQPKQSKDGLRQYVRNVVPAFVRNPDGSKGMLLRKCTADFKIAPIKRKQRLLMREAGATSVVSWIGISTDEASRMKPSRVKYVTHRFPLIEMDMSRSKCLAWMDAHGFAQPPKSACTFCPYHSDDQWRELKLNDPDAFQDAVSFELEWNAVVSLDKRATQTRGVIYLHRSCAPLDSVDFRNAKDFGQQDLFENECEGMCGL